MLASVTIYSDYKKIHYLVSEVDFYIYVCLSIYDYISEKSN